MDTYHLAEPFQFEYNQLFILNIISKYKSKNGTLGNYHFPKMARQKRQILQKSKIFTKNFGEIFVANPVFRFPC